MDAMTDTSISTSGRVALVTGASGGIGRATVERLVSDGYSVAVHYVGNKEKADAIVAAVTASNGKAIAVGGDVADENAMSAAFDAIESAFGGIDVVVNLAGIMPLAPIVDLDLEVFDRIVRTNLRGAFVVSQLAARRVREGGAIINTSTSVTKLRFPAYAAYAACKSGVETMTAILAKELRGRNVTANAVAPGPTETPLFTQGKTADQIAQSANAAPLGRLGQPEDIADVIAFLAAPGVWVNGQTVYANGGVI
jgi:3-oxoacyl-[acyl-carrier protein] reductase